MDSCNSRRRSARSRLHEHPRRRPSTLRPHGVADAAVWRAALAHEAAADDNILHDRLYHIHATQHAFLQAWCGEDVVFTKAEEYAGLDAVLRFAREFYAAAPAYVAAIAPDAVDAEMVLPWSSYFAKRAGFAAHPSTLGETLLQLPSHSTYHRGR